MELYPDGITLTTDIYQNLMNSIQRDCRVLESFKIMDYSLLIGIHNIDQVIKNCLLFYPNSSLKLPKILFLINFNLIIIVFSGQ